MIIGLTGGIATGKSTVAEMLKEFGLPVVDADFIAKEVMQPEGAAFDEVISEFGSDIVQEDGTINRALLGQRIFSNEEERLKLNAIVHPKVRKEMRRAAVSYTAEGHAHVVLDIPLLYESNLFHMVDRVLLIYVSPAVQLQRLIKRDQSGEEQARARIAAQIPIDEKESRADGVISNDGTKAETRQELEQLLSQWNILKKP
ncbi:dephospho-CoA kinase [Alkalicoccobacillus porphyridii]|uniref:Dephospho-CoA kinase n=1 Tax=Alkalicoccobacillus porphyridii TaxID=2597270 RepID=A0A554A309_9BACI|nr:dephospho-CoA kinase [Alkalicoccobacillus porphyridii]TSB48026.1 dephospho-CoA kinase [Alkalicoccobacillus porphyridii]